MSILLTQKQKEDLVISARERITPLERWTTYSLAETKTGKTVASTHIHADRWCAYGSLEKSLYQLVPKRDRRESSLSL